MVVVAALAVPTADAGGVGLNLYVAGSLANADGVRLPRGPAVARILAVGGGNEAKGVARIEVSVSGRRGAVSNRRFECSPSCPGSGRLRFAYDARRFGARGAVTIRAVDGAGESVARRIAFRAPPRHPSPGGPGRPPRGTTPAATIPQPAFYLTGPDPARLRRQAYRAGERFARTQGPGHSLLVLDFGAARLHGDTFGSSLRSARFFTNRQIGAALEAAAHGYRHGYRRGTATIVFANSNAKLTRPESGRPVTGTRARQAGVHQAETIERLSRYPHQRFALGGDIEPGYDYGAPGASAARSLVAGAVAGSGGLYFDVGTAPCTKRNCGRGWTLGDICAVSSNGSRRALPEIYLSTQAEQWGAVARSCRIGAFPGVSTSPIGGLTPPQSRRLLRVETNATVGDPLIVWPG